MKNRLAFICAALAGLSAYAADYSATIPSGDPLEQWHFNLKDGQALDPNTASGQGIFLWNDGAALPALPSLEDSFSVTADTITFRAWPWDFGGSNTIYAKNFDITAKEGRFFANGSDIPTYLEVAEKGYEGILKHFIEVDDNGVVSLTQTCAVAGLGGKPYRSGEYDYYINEKIRSNDPKAVGPFINASLERERLEK